ncbi:MAG: hypothetical protein Q4G60_14910 [bacterium]|nr:hypothetical protein [bacterium]
MSIGVQNHIGVQNTVYSGWQSKSKQISDVDKGSFAAQVYDKQVLVKN